MANLKDLRAFRLQKLEKLKSLGIDPYPAVSFRDTDAIQIIEKYETKKDTIAIVGGRITSIRTHGQLAFIDIKDQTGKIQLYIKKEKIADPIYANNEIGFYDIELLDLGDFIEGKGIITKTPSGEISLEVTMIRLLTKALRPMPSKWDGLKDKETRLRRRYLDTNINEDVFKRFERRARFWEAHREFFKKNGFLEMNIPVLETIAGGADAHPFITHMNVIDQDFYLRISQELYLKRLIGGGYHKVYEIGPRFRNEGLSDEHLPEHMAMEFYWAYADWREGMEFTKELFRYVAQEVYQTLKFQIRGFDVDLGKDWEEIDFCTIIKERFNIDVFHTNLKEVTDALKTQNQPIANDINVNRGIDQLWKLIRATIAGPAFMVYEPKFLSPLAKSDPTRPELTQRFHPLFAGSETGNAWSELNDPIDQLERFKEQQKMRDAGDDEAQMLDIDYVEMLEYGMPPTFGYGHSERVFWFLENVSAREGVPFTQLRREIDPDTKLIYPELFQEEAKQHIVTVTKKEEKSIESKNTEQDFSKKMVVVINRDLPAWQAMNALSHISAYIGNRIGSTLTTSDTFSTKDNALYPRNAQYPFIIASAKPGQMRNLMQKVRDSGLLYHAFIREMIEITDDNEIQKILATKEDKDIEYLGIGIFGHNSAVESLTKNYSVWK